MKKRQLSDKGMVTICTMLFAIMVVFVIGYICYNHGKVDGYNKGYNYVIQNQIVSRDEISGYNVSLIDKTTYEYTENGVNIYKWEKGAY